MLEARGIATVMLGNMPRRMELIRPPRALRVRSQNGQMIGLVHEREAQIFVLRQALGLLDVAPGDGQWVLKTCPERA